jgi:hypothetical protein
MSNDEWLLNSPEVLESITISGLRGFAEPQTLNLAVPDGRNGSGLTTVVGANNAGKSTIVEALRALVQRQPPSFSQGRRNQMAGDLVDIAVTDTRGAVKRLRSVRPGSSQTEYGVENGAPDLSTVMVLPSRRVFQPYFGSTELGRNDYIAAIGFPDIRSSTLDQFTYRLFRIEKHRYMAIHRTALRAAAARRSETVTTQAPA